MAGIHPHGKNTDSSRSLNSASGPVAVGRFVAPLAGHALSRGGTVLAELISEWPNIAGTAVAAYTRPAKISKGASEPGFTAKNSPSLLLLKVEPARALEVQYLVPQLIERINQTLGFKAVSALRIIQVPMLNKPARAPLAKSKAAPAIGQPENASRLGAALARMSAGMKTRGLSG